MAPRVRFIVVPGIVTCQPVTQRLVLINQFRRGHYQPHDRSHDGNDQSSQQNAAFLPYATRIADSRRKSSVFHKRQQQGKTTEPRIASVAKFHPCSHALGKILARIFLSHSSASSKLLKRKTPFGNPVRGSARCLASMAAQYFLDSSSDFWAFGGNGPSLEVTEKLAKVRVLFGNRRSPRISLLILLLILILILF